VFFLKIHSDEIIVGLTQAIEIFALKHFSHLLLHGHSAFNCVSVYVRSKLLELIFCFVLFCCCFFFFLSVVNYTSIYVEICQASCMPPWTCLAWDSFFPIGLFNKA